MPELTSKAGGNDSDVIAIEELEALFRPLADYDVLYLAVSGGADSMALMHLVADWRAGESEVMGARREVRVLSVNHGLRSEARAEAQWVAAQARERGLCCEILTIEVEPPASGIQEWARDQRYNVLCTRVVGGGGTAALVTGHHQGDVAETVLMRLARGSGVDGLAAMAVKTARDGADILRPLLDIPKSRLVATLNARGAAWIEDPSNASDTFERVRLRKLQAERVALGLGDEALARTARRLGRARDALDAVSETMLGVVIDRAGLAASGLITLPARLLRDLPEEIGLRVLMRALVAAGGTHGQLRLARLERLYAAIQKPDFKGATLGNTIIRAGEGAIAGLGEHEPVLEIYREPDRGRLPVIDSTLEAPVVWDNRFVVRREPPGGGVVRIRALERRDVAVLLGVEKAEGLSVHESLRSTPVIVEADGRVFAPALALACGRQEGGMIASPYRAEFMVARLFSGPSPKSRAFLPVLNMANAMRGKGSPSGTC